MSSFEGEGTSLRLLGNQAYEAKDFKSAEKLYTQCIELPSTDEKCRSLAYSNRYFGVFSTVPILASLD